MEPRSGKRLQVGLWGRIVEGLGGLGGCQDGNSEQGAGASAHVEGSEEHWWHSMNKLHRFHVQRQKPGEAPRTEICIIHPFAQRHQVTPCFETIHGVPSRMLKSIRNGFRRERRTRAAWENGESQKHHVRSHIVFICSIYKNAAKGKRTATLKEYGIV